MPESTHIGSITRFIRPDTVSIVFARLAISKPKPGKRERPKSRSTATTSKMLPWIAHAEHQPGEDKQDQHFGDHEHSG